MKWDEKTKNGFFGCLHNSPSNNVQICNLMCILFFFSPLQYDFFKDVKSLHLIMLLEQAGKQEGRRRAKKLVCYFESFFSWYLNKHERRDINDSNWWYLIMVNEGVIIIKHAQILSWILRLSLLKKKILII